MTPKPENPSASESPSAPKSLPAALQSLDVRAMTKDEISRDGRSCSGTAPPGSARVSQPTMQYARVQRRAGLDGPGAEVRVLITQNADVTESCLDGSALETVDAQSDNTPRPSRSVPAVEVANIGNTHAACGTRETSLVTTSKLYVVADTVTVGRIRLNRGSSKGPWQLTTPLDGLVYFPMALIGGEAWKMPTASFDVQFLDRNGKRVTIQPFGPSETGVSETSTTQIENCVSINGREKAKITPPESDAAGRLECLALAADGEPEGRSFPQWKAEVVVSTKTEWGAVLSDGQRRFGCSLFPTKEVSQVTSDRATISKSSFSFALNPIAANDGVSLWAAGRVPKDVTKISYVLPGGREAAAQPDDAGYWMVKYHLDGADLASGNVSDWDPVVVTVTRPGTTLTYRIPFSEDSMCNQVSHGC